jgi:hypothetical protein
LLPSGFANYIKRLESRRRETARVPKGYWKELKIKGVSQIETKQEETNLE